MKGRENRPSRIALAFFQWYCEADYVEEIEGDLLERFNTAFKKYGYAKANRLFIRDVILLFRPAIIGNIYQLTNTEAMIITKQNKRLISILTAAMALLIVPMVAMNYTNEVNWHFPDFLVAGVLLCGTGLVLEFILRKIKSTRFKILFGILLFLTLFLVWAELAVGIFGTALAGS